MILLANVNIVNIEQTFTFTYNHFILIQSYAIEKIYHSQRYSCYTLYDNEEVTRKLVI